jgi:hypothetical protein
MQRIFPFRNPVLGCLAVVMYICLLWKLTYLLLLDWLQDLYDALLVVDDMDTLKYFAILASPHFPDNFIVFLTPVHNHSVNITLGETEGTFEPPCLISKGLCQPPTFLTSDPGRGAFFATEKA